MMINRNRMMILIKPTNNAEAMVAFNDSRRKKYKPTMKRPTIQIHWGRPVKGVMIAPNPILRANNWMAEKMATPTVSTELPKLPK